MTRRGRDLRLLGPAVAAWATAWCAVAAPDVGVPAWVPAVVAWAVAGVLVASLAVRHGVQAGPAKPKKEASMRRAVTSPPWAGLGRGDCRPRRGARVVASLWSALRGLAGADRGVLPKTARTSSGPTARSSALAAALLAASAAALVAQSAAVTAGVREQSPLHAAADSGTQVDVVVELTTAPRMLAPNAEAPWAAAEGQRVRYRAALTAVAGHAVPRVTVGVVSSAAEGLVFGAKAAFRARVDRVEAAEAASFRLRPTAEILTSPPGGPVGWAAGLREGFAAAAARLGGDGGALVPGLAIGDTSAVGAELDADMKVSSLTHLTAVSGANCAIVTALVFALAAACGAPRIVRVGAALVALTAFVLLVTPESSVMRAAVMAVVVLVATAAGRPGGGAAALSLAVVVLLTVDPWYARDYGFALSVFATGGLLLLAGPLGAQLARFMPRPLAMALAVPLAAQLACQPVLILLDPAIASYGVVANLLAGPAAPVATMVGLAGCLVLPLLPSVGFAALQFAAVPATWIALVAHGVAALPAARLPWVADAGGALLLAAGTASGIWLLLARRRPRWLLCGVVGALLVAIAVPIGVALGGPALRRAGLPDDWVVAACDIGQGDAVLVRDGDAVALIDTGPDDAALDRCLAFLSVDRIDLLVLTHWDADHVAAVGVVAGRVSTVVHGPLDGARSTQALRPLVDGGAEAHEVTAGVRGRLGGASWQVLWPPPEQEPGNDASVVLHLRSAAFRGVFLGDLGEAAQARLLRDAEPGPVDLVKVAHHGSADQSPALYDALQATVGVIGVGADNGYGHPTASLLELLERDGTAVVRTDLSGTALLSVEHGGFRLWSERDAPAGEVGGRP